MPNAKILESKQAVVENLAERMKNSTSGVFVDYKGITVAQDSELRNQLRAAEVEYSVVKNTLTRFAANKIGYESFDPILNGTTSLATTTGDPIIPIRILNDYAKKMVGKFELKAGFIEGSPVDAEQLAQLALLPSKDGLLSQVLGTFLAPITSLAVVLDQIAKAKEEAAV